MRDLLLYIIAEMRSLAIDELGILRGGPGSGYGDPHYGRPGEVGGSSPRDEGTPAGSQETGGGAPGTSGLREPSGEPTPQPTTGQRHEPTSYAIAVPKKSYKTRDEAYAAIEAAGFKVISKDGPGNVEGWRHIGTSQGSENYEKISAFLRYKDRIGYYWEKTEGRSFAVVPEGQEPPKYGSLNAVLNQPSKPKRGAGKGGFVWPTIHPYDPKNPITYVKDYVPPAPGTPLVAPEGYKYESTKRKVPRPKWLGHFASEYDIQERGGPGSGYGDPHYGRPGEQGGSSPRGEAASALGKSVEPGDRVGGKYGGYAFAGTVRQIEADMSGLPGTSSVGSVTVDLDEPLVGPYGSEIPRESLRLNARIVDGQWKITDTRLDDDRSAFRITTPYANIEEGFQLTGPGGANARGYLWNADFPGEASSATRGELFYVDVPEPQRRKGHGLAIASEALRRMVEKGALTVNMSAVSPEGKSLIQSMLKRGLIEGPVRTSATGKAEYRIGKLVERGGPGSGHFGHEGRPGKVGGSLPNTTGVGLTPSRPGKRAGRIKQQIDKFGAEISKLGDVRTYGYAQGVYKGQAEDSIQMEYVGDGEMLDRIAEQARQWDQDSAIVYGPNLAVGKDSAVGKLRFSGLPDEALENKLGEVMMQNGIDGWTWVRTKGKATLVVVGIPQFGVTPRDYEKTIRALTAYLKRNSIDHRLNERLVKVAVASKDGDYQWQ